MKIPTMPTHDPGRHLAVWLLEAWSMLKWRRHGIGVLQAYLAEGGGAESRVHVWHPSLLRDGIRDHGDIHDHRFSFVSTVLVGQIVNRVATVRENPNGAYHVHQVLHARANPEGVFAAEPMRVVPGPLGPTAQFVDVDFCDVPVITGDSYFFGRGEFHSTVAYGLAVTVLTKFDQVEAGARVLARRETPPVPAFAPGDADDIQLAGLMDAVLRDARRAVTEVLRCPST